MQRILLACVSTVLLAGCAGSYVTPPSGVTMAELTDSTDRNLRRYYNTQPASPFPANIAVVRVQDHNYYTRSARGVGDGRYSVVVTRDIESDDAVEKFRELPLVSRIAPIGKILLPPQTNTLRDLRVPAAKLHADLLLVYSVDTAFHVEGKSLGPLSTISLGLIRNKKAHVSSTVAGVLVDVRTGYIYGTTEATATETQKASIWSEEHAIDTARLRAEKIAFSDFVDEFGSLWKGVVDVYAASPGRVATVPPRPVEPATLPRNGYWTDGTH
ncbi:MAG: hypothetical protein AAF351_02325 [Pseudomonadota bacterium]